MNITDLNECLSELPEISVHDLYSKRQPIESAIRWTGEDALDAHSTDCVGPIVVDNCGIEYVVHAMDALLEKAHACHEPITCDAKVSRVTRPNNTVFFQDMTHSCDISPDLRRALLAFAVTKALAKVA